MKEKIGKVKFSFVFTDKITKRLLKPNGKKSFTIGVELDVHYANNDLKRFAFEIAAENSEQATFSTDVGVDDGKGKNVADSSLTLVASILFMMVALLF